MSTCLIIKKFQECFDSLFSLSFEMF